MELGLNKNRNEKGDEMMIFMAGDSKEFDWKCKDCGQDIPVSEGHVEGKCLKCAKKEEDVENAEMETKAKESTVKTKDVETGDDDSDSTSK